MRAGRRPGWRSSAGSRSRRSTRPGPGSALNRARARARAAGGGRWPSGMRRRPSGLLRSPSRAGHGPAAVAVARFRRARRARWTGCGSRMTGCGSPPPPGTTRRSASPQGPRRGCSAWPAGAARLRGAIRSMRKVRSMTESNERPLRVGRRAACTALSVAGIVLSLAACSAAAGVEPASVVTSAAGTAPRGSYVALGDSYTAGPDIPDQTGSSYPYLVARSLRLNLTDMSCSGATIADLSAPQPAGDATNPAQLSALSAATALVTLGIGGNDIGWSAILTRCTELDLIPALIPGGAASDLAPCQAYYTSGGTDRIQQKIQAVAGDLAGALTEIGRRAPHARVYVVGYPELLPAVGGTCAHTMGITQSDATFLDNEELRLNSCLLYTSPSPR